MSKYSDRQQARYASDLAREGKVEYVIDCPHQAKHPSHEAISRRFSGRNRIPHSGNVLLEVAEGVERLRGELPKIGQAVESMQALRLNRDEQRAFAGAALMLKYDEGQAPVNAERVLQTRRAEDEAPTLWNTFNTVQEHLVRGGDHYQTETKAGRRQNRKTSAVGSVSGQTSINRALWRLAEEMQKIKAYRFRLEGLRSGALRVGIFGRLGHVSHVEDWGGPGGSPGYSFGS